MSELTKLIKEVEKRHKNLGKLYDKLLNVSEEIFNKLEAQGEAIELLLPAAKGLPKDES